MDLKARCDALEEIVEAQNIRPMQLREQPEFRALASLQALATPQIPTLIDLAVGTSSWMSSYLALDVLATHPKGAEAMRRVRRLIETSSAGRLYFVLRYLQAHTPATEPLVGWVLVKTNADIPEQWALPILRGFVQDRVQAGEQLKFGPALRGTTAEQWTAMESRLADFEDPIVQPLLHELAAWRASAVDLEFLRSVGRISAGAEDDAVGTAGIHSTGAPIFEHTALVQHVDCLESTFLEVRSTSVLLVGEHGVGKSAIVRKLAERLVPQGWVVFEAGATQIIAGQKYIGEIEQRIVDIVTRLDGKKVLWHVPEFQELQWAGAHDTKPRGALDLLMPDLESGRVRILGELTVDAHELLVRNRPACLHVFETRRVAPLDKQITLDLARRWSLEYSADSQTPLVTSAVLGEAQALAQQYLGDRAAPGNLLHLLRLTLLRLQLRTRLSTGDGPLQIRAAEILATLSELTGLPQSILDERARLDLADLRTLFERNILGQPEAVECLVERVAMIKAGVTDPTRPLGVFLFAGPTGTGKTEIARMLARFLFGSEDRLVRIDMSELQTPDSISRLTGATASELAPSPVLSLADQIRKQPFAVVLLDEFEKAHVNVWDFFLQVFDAGRLTDARGRTADFRNTILIMTSNLGGVVPSGTSLGFGRGTASFSPEIVNRVIEKTFRREFLNRIDRVVVFHPLSRDTMRDILRKQLLAIPELRGLRNRAWVIEWDDDALEFLLVRGFTADLGARPLRRAIERYLLSPLAMTIVNHDYPQGDQFLFVHASGDRLIVEFVDPNVPEVVAVASHPPGTRLGELDGDERADAAALDGHGLRIEQVAFSAAGTSSEMERLRQEVQRLRTEVEGDAWQCNKQAALELMSHADFWNSTERFAVLGEIEYLDRIESAMASARSLLDRISGSATPGRQRYRRDLIERVAQQLYLVAYACTGVAERVPRDAFLLLESERTAGFGAGEADAFARRLGSMYRAWAERRHMQLQVLEETPPSARDAYRLMLAVSGLAAYSILALESGFHILKVPENNGFRRVRARVRIVGQPPEPTYADNALHRQAEGAFRGASTAGAPPVVRVYRDSPAPRVRDAVRGWSTGRIERVLGGDFDLIGASRDAP